MFIVKVGSHGFNVLVYKINSKWNIFCTFSIDIVSIRKGNKTAIDYDCILCKSIEQKKKKKLAVKKIKQARLTGNAFKR